MTLLNITPNLTKTDPDFSASVAKTHCGMAHFAATGPRGARCHQCAFWREAAYAAKPDTNKSTLKPATCQRYTQLTGKIAQKVPAKAHACKYFQAFGS